MNLDELCICGDTCEVHFGGECTRIGRTGTPCNCKQFVSCELAVPMFEALKALEEQVADFRAGRTWDADYIGLKQAHLKAKVVLQRASVAAPR